MAASSLMRLCVVVLILIALAMTSSIAWGSLDDPDEPAVQYQLAEPASILGID